MKGGGHMIKTPVEFLKNCSMLTHRYLTYPNSYLLLYSGLIGYLVPFLRPFVICLRAVVRL